MQVDTWFQLWRQKESQDAGHCGVSAGGHRCSQCADCQGGSHCGRQERGGCPDHEKHMVPKKGFSLIDGLFARQDVVRLLNPPSPFPRDGVEVIFQRFASSGPSSTQLEIVQALLNLGTAGLNHTQTPSAAVNACLGQSL